ncbi:MAG: ribonuclease R [Clostridia bacterium]|nr:ribonuclease R [Clostridia bacterium]
MKNNQNEETTMEDIIVNALENWQGRMPDEMQLLSAIESEMDIKSFRKLLKKMEKHGEVMQTQKGKWAIPIKIGYLTGVVDRNIKGFGFLRPFDTDFEDVYIASSNLKGAMDGDTVLVSLLTKPFKGEKKTEGVVYKILKRSQKTIVGKLEIIPSGGFVVPDNNKNPHDIYIPRGNINGAQDGDKVVARITSFPTNKRSPVGEIVETLGSASDIGVDVLSIIKALDLRETFKNKVLELSDEISRQNPADSMEGRLDLRDEITVTIDGADSKDFDDAVSISKISDKLYRLGVHIADVSHYVVPNEPIDKEAYIRATSIYLIDRVIPMLPESLSNGICSLNPGVDRLCLSCVMDINLNGEVVSYNVAKTIINSKARLTYDQVNLLFEGDEAAKKELKNIEKKLFEMNALAKILQKKRIQRGALELDIDEAHILLDQKGVPFEVSARVRGDSHKLIEEFMLCANETVASHLSKNKAPCMYRIHEQPDPEKMKEFGRFANNLGYKLMGSSEDITPKQLQNLLNDAKDKPEEDVLHRVLLRTLQKARYSPVNEGHYGLASDMYCHFTSPIRRYPDLVVHRACKALIDNDAAYISYLRTIIDQQSQHCSEKERDAMEAERKVDDLKMTEFMSYHLNEEFDAIISGVTEFGFFVELSNTIEGLVHMNELTDDYYVYYEEGYMLQGTHKGKIYKLGDKVKVVCIRADVADCRIDFTLAGTA